MKQFRVGSFETCSQPATVGDSIEPRFHKGDLALVRRAADYKVGEIVLYQSPVLHRPVLHRILVIQHGHYFFKGDHNGFVDPGYATRAELLGKLWFRVPRAGSVFNWFGAPTHAALLAAVAAVFLVLGGGTTRRRRRRRHGRPRRAGRAAMTGRAPMRSRARGVIHRPRKTVENIVGGVALALAAVLLLVGFSSPVSRAVQVPGYRQAGVVSYSAKVSQPSVWYPSGTARTGQPLLLKYFSLIDVGFSYRFSSKLTHAVQGTVALDAVLTGSPSLHRRFVLERPTPFSGDTARITGTFDLHALQTLLAKLALDSGVAGTEYTINLEPVVHVTGWVGGTKIRPTFSPTVPFTATQTILQPSGVQTPTLPGATYSPTATSALDTSFKPVELGTLPGIAPNYATFVRYHLPISLLRGLALGLLGLGVIALLSKLFKAPRELWSNERRVAFRHGCVIVDVISVGDRSSSDRGATEVPEFESLATLAQYCERPILRETRAAGCVYGVEDDGRLYIYRAKSAPEVSPTVPVEPIAPVRPSAPRARRRSLIRPLGLLFVLAVGATFVTSFTATTTVPLSYAGTSTQPLAVGELAPVQCAGIALATLVPLTAGNTATGTAASDLILGKSGTGTFNLSGAGGDDCIVGGGGAGTTNKFDGGPGTNNICIGAPGATNTFKNCARTY